MSKVRVGAVLLALSFVACGNTGNDGPDPQGVNGGAAKFDASAPTDDTMSATNTGGVDAGTAWSDLYRDYFGKAPPGPGCAGTGQCHGDSAQAGSQSSSDMAHPNGYVCGHDKDTCYKGITGTIAPGGNTQDHLVDPAKDAANPRMSRLINIELRSVDHKMNPMPLNPPTFQFDEVALTRISAWIAAGAPNN